MKHHSPTTTPADPSGWRCTYFDDEARALLDAAPGWLTPDSSDAVLLKENDLRRVWRMATSGKAVIIKQHRLRGAAAIKARLLGDPATREARAARYAREHGVPVAQMLAVATRRTSGGIEAIGVSRALDDARPLNEVFASLAEGSERGARLRALAAAVADLLVHAHRGRFIHPDGHPGNILVRQRDGDFECTYIDVYGAKCGREVDMPAAARNLAAIQQWFLPRTSRTERFRVLAAYAAGRGWSRRAQRRMLAALIAKQSTKHAFALYAERDRRIGGNNRWYAVERTKDGVIVRTRRWRPSAAELLSAGRTILGDSIDEPSLAPNAAREVVVPHSRWMAFKWRVVGSPVARRFRSAAYAMHRDLPTIAPAEWRARRGRGALEEWRAIVPAGGESLPVWLARSGGRRRIAALEAAGRLLADSLARGLIMRTLAADRMGLLDLPGRPVRVYWDGVEAATRRRPATVGQAGWVLAELLASVSYLALTRTDCAHLLRAFARRRGEDWRRWWRMLAPQMSEIK